MLTTNKHADADSALNVGLHNGLVVLTNEMLLVTDPDFNPANLSENTPPEQLVYTIEKRPEHGELQLFVGGGLGPGNDGWIVLGDKGRFTQDDINHNRLRYFQTTDTGGDLVDSFTFTVRDSAFGYDVWTDPSNPTAGREGGVRNDPKDTDLAVQEFHFILTTPHTKPDDTNDDYAGEPRRAEPGYGVDDKLTLRYEFVPEVEDPGNKDREVWHEAVGDDGSYIVTTDMLNYTITRIAEFTDDDNEEQVVEIVLPPAETVYTLTSQPENGVIERRVDSQWVMVHTNGQFTQADINKGDIRFRHDGSENHVSTFGFTVSDGTEYNKSGTFAIDITPTNDQPVATGGETQVREGEGHMVSLGRDVLGMSDADGSDQEDKWTTDEGGEDFLWFKITGLPTDGDTERGTLERWDGSKWIVVDLDTWLPSSLLTALDGESSGLRYVHDGSEPLAYKDGRPVVTFTYVVRDDLEEPADAFEVIGSGHSDYAVKSATGKNQAHESAPGTATINIIPVNEAPQVPTHPGVPEGSVDVEDTIDGGGATTGVNKVLANVPEGSELTISSAHLTAVDRDNTKIQRQYRIIQAPEDGVLTLDGKVLSVGATFTQADIDNGLLKYRHNGGELENYSQYESVDYHDKFHFVVSDGALTDTGDEQHGNVFLITLTPTNDAPVVTAPTPPAVPGSAFYIGPEGSSAISGFSVADPDLDHVIDELETDHVTVVVRLTHPNGTGFSEDDYKGVEISVTTVGGVEQHAEFDGEDTYLVLSGKQSDINDTLDSLKVVFPDANDPDYNEEREDKIYRVQVIADDRLRNEDGDLLTQANGGTKNQPETPGDTPQDIVVTHDVNGWYGNEFPGSGDILNNLHASDVEIRVSVVNEPVEISPPPATPVDVHEDTWSRVNAAGNTIVIGDPESAAFGTPITVTLSVGEGNGSLRVGSQAGVTVTGNSGHTVTLTGSVTAINSLLAAGNGLEYRSLTDVNGDLNEGAEGDVTLTITVVDTGSAFGVPKDGSGNTHAGNDPVTEKIKLTIIPVNDAPTVNNDSADDVVLVDDRGWFDVGGFKLDDPDAGFDYAEEGVEDGIIQVTVRLLDVNGAPLSGASYRDGENGAEISFQTKTNQAGLGNLKVDSELNGENAALRIYGTKSEIQAYLNGLQVDFENPEILAKGGNYAVQVLVDDRLYEYDDATDTWGLKLGTDDKPIANGGALNQGTNNSGTQTISNITYSGDAVYTTTTSAWTSIYNVDAATRELFVSSVNDPAQIIFEDDLENSELNDKETEDKNTVTLAGLKIQDPDAKPGDDLIVTINLPDQFSFAHTTGGSIEVSNNGKTIQFTGTLDEINTWISGVTINLPDLDGEGVARAQDWNGSFDFTVVVNDGGNTGVTNGNIGDTSTDENGHEFEVVGYGEDGKAIQTTRTFTFVVEPTNDAPLVVDNEIPVSTAETSLAPVEEDFTGSQEPTAESGHKTVEDLFSDFFNDDRDAINNGPIGHVTDGTDADNFWGVAVIGNEATSDQGTWQYFDGDEWENIPTSFISGEALLLGKDTYIQFVPNENWSGKPGELTVRLVETLEETNPDKHSSPFVPGQTGAESGATITLGPVGGSSLVSVGTVTLTTFVTAINDAPVVVGPPADLVEIEDESSSGRTVSSLFGDVFNDDADDIGNSVANELAGIAIIGVTDSDHGKWQYEAEPGRWEDLPDDVSKENAFLLRSTDNLRFLPNPDYNGVPNASLTVHLIDDSDPTLDFRIRQNLSAADATGGRTPFSEESTDLRVKVDPRNDKPTLTVGEYGAEDKIEIKVTEKPGLAGPGTDDDPYAGAPVNVQLLEGVTVDDIDLDSDSLGGPGTGDERIFGAGLITITLDKAVDGDLLYLLDPPPAIDGAVPASVYSSENGTVTLTIQLTESATVGQVEKILESVRYVHITDDPTAIKSGEERGSLDFTVVLSDGNNTQAAGDAGGPQPKSVEVSGKIELNPVNDPPVANDDVNHLTNKQPKVSGNLIFGTGKDGSGDDITPNLQDYDPDTHIEDLRVSGIRATTDMEPGESGDMSSVEGTTQLEGKYGTLTVTPEGGYTYFLNPNHPDVYGLLAGDQPLHETFEYQLVDSDSDGLEAENPGVLTITINGTVPEAPTIVPDDHNEENPDSYVNGHNTVYEKGLLFESDSSEIASGTIRVETDTGIATVTIGDVSFTVAELTVDSDLFIEKVFNMEHGTLRITGFTPDTGEDSQHPRSGSLNYTYTLTDPVKHGAPGESGHLEHMDSTAVAVTQRGVTTSATGTLQILIIDDAPVAQPDVNSVTEGQMTAAKGDVITDVGTGQDVVGADGATVTGVQLGTVAAGTHVADGGVDATDSYEVEVPGDYGTLKLNANGSYEYVLDNSNLVVRGLSVGQELTETYTYTLTDTDGDKSTTTLTITIEGADDGVTVDVPPKHPDTPAANDKTDHVVFERGLDGGSAPSADDLLVESSFTVLALDGLDDDAAITIGYMISDDEQRTLTLTRAELEALSSTTTQTITTQYGTLVLNGYSQDTSGDADHGKITVSYIYTLTTAPEVTGEEASDRFVITATDSDPTDPDSAEQTLTIKIIDDAPVAEDDVNSVTEGQTTVATGNVITGAGAGAGKDTVGADGAIVTGVTTDEVPEGSHVADGGVDTSNGHVVEVEGSYGTLKLNADGSYEYLLDNDNLVVQGLSEGETLEDIYTYTITDADGDQSTATLTITITGEDDLVTVDVPHTYPAEPQANDTADHVVFERGLDDGSAPSKDDLLVESSFTILALDGLDDEAAITLGYTDSDGMPQTFELTRAELEALSSTTTQTITTQYGTLVLNGYSQDTSGGEDHGKITVSYTYTLTTAPEVTGEETSDEFVITATDSDLTDPDSNTQTLTIKIIDDAPVARNDVNTIDRGVEHEDGYTNQAKGNVYNDDTIGADGPHTDGPLSNVTGGTWDPDTETWTVPGTYGTLTIGRDGNYTYVLDTTLDVVKDLKGDEDLTEVFTYFIKDADSDEDDATLTITIWGNTPPVPQPDVRTTPEDTPVSGNVLKDGEAGDQPDTDADDDTLVVTEFTVDGVTVPVTPDVPGTTEIPGVGTITIESDGSYEFIPVSDWHGDVPQITYTVSDGKDGTATTTLDITVTPVPDIADDTSTTLVDVPVTLNPLGNDDFENPDRKVTGTTQPANGTVTVHPDGKITYTPDPGFIGEDTFTYTVTSGGVTETATVTITVTNQPPVAEPDTNTVPEDTPATGNVLTNDGDPNDHPVKVTEFTVEGQSYPPGSTVDIPGTGTITIDEDGSYTFTPVPDWHGDVPVIEYTIDDGYGGTDRSTLTITVTPVPDIEDDTVETPSGTPVTFDPLDNDDFEGDNPVVSVEPGDGPSNGTVTVHPDGSITYTPDPGFEGEDSFTYTVTSGGRTETATVTITVTPVEPEDEIPGGELPGEPGEELPGEPGEELPGEPGEELPGEPGEELPGEPDEELPGSETPPELPEPEDDIRFHYPDAGIPGTWTPGSPGTGPAPSPAGMYQQEMEQSRNPVLGDQVRDPSVFFDGSVYNKLPRLPLPFHPIVYVNREVQAVQNERALTDVRARSNTFWSQPGVVGSTSIGAGLGQDPNLFVTREVRNAQTRGHFLDRVVASRLSRVGLSSDGRLPTPDLSAVPPMAPAPAPAQDAPPADEAAADTAAPVAASTEAASPEATESLSLVPAGADDLAEAGQVDQLAHAAPSFSEQLRGGSGRLPMTLHAPKDLS